MKCIIQGCEKDISKYGYKKYCSTHISRKRRIGTFDLPKHKSPKERFLEKVDKKSLNDCWNWLGTSSKGYGHFWDSKNQVQAHRFSYKLFVGEIPYGLFVCHRCDNRKCVNPSHLFLGTHQDNMIDRAKKGRGNNPIGENNGNSKLTLDMVTQIKTLSKSGYKCRKLGKMFNVSHATISRIIHDKLWVHVHV